MECIVDECSQPRKIRGLCNKHHVKWWRGALDVTPLPSRNDSFKTICSVDGCGRKHYARGYCGTHYVHALARGEIKAGVRNAIDSHGYIRIWLPDHPNAQKSGYILEHVAVMSGVVGRPLLPGETVHHRNGDKVDNRPENLELWATRHCKGARVEDLLEWAREIITRYG